MERSCADLGVGPNQCRDQKSQSSEADPELSETAVRRLSSHCPSTSHQCPPYCPKGVDTPGMLGYHPAFLPHAHVGSQYVILASFKRITGGWPTLSRFFL